jgi:hypothetical protein
MADREADLVRRYYGEALNPGRFELLDDLLTADFWTMRSCVAFHRHAMD